jgi:uncharacterized protein YoxC
MPATELEVLQDISKKMDENKELQTKEIAKLREEATELTTKYEAGIKTLQEDLSKKDATILDITNEVKELKAGKGRLYSGQPQVKTLYGLIAETVEAHKDKFMEAHTKSIPVPLINMETKVVGNIASANLTGGNYVSYLPWQPGMEPTGQTRFRDIFPVYQSEGDFINYPRAKDPIGEGSFGRQTEGATKPQVDRDYEMISLTLKPMAGFAVVSRQSLRNIPFLQSWLPTSLLESLLDAEDIDFANTLVAAATGSSTTTGVTIAVDRLIHFIKNLRKNKYSANAIMIDPDIWAYILTYRTSNLRDLPDTITVDANGNVRVLGRPIYDVNWLTGGRVLVGDTRKAGIIQSEGLTLRQSDSHASIFTSNEVAFLLERTEGLAIFRPDAFITAVFPLS